MKLKQRMKRRSLIILSASVFICVYFVFNILQYLANDDFDLYLRNGLNSVINSYSLAYSHLDLNQEEQAIKRLQEAAGAGNIHFYAVKKKGQILEGYQVNEKTDLINLNLPAMNGFDVTDRYYYATGEVKGYFILVGFFKDRKQNIIYKLKSRKDLFIRDTLFVLGIIVAVLMYFLKDILDLLKNLGRSGKKDYSSVETKSREAEMFVQGLTAYEEMVGGLASENAKLKNQVLPSLQLEINSGRKPPYEFNCTLVRTDINNFSHIFGRYPVEPFMEKINHFFEEASFVISRYNGLVHEFVGDEIIFYFKDENTENSCLAAISAIKDLNKIAEGISRQTQSHYGYKFTVKSSLAYGKLRYGLQVRNYALAGSVLIETVRILSHINEKEENTIFYDVKVEEKIQGLIISQKEQEVLLKGIPEVKQLFSYKQHRPLAHLLKNLDQASLQYMPYFRSDVELASVLRFLTENAETLDRQTFNQILNSFRQIKALRTHQEVKENYFHLLSRLIELRDQHARSRESYLLSAAIKVGVNLVAPDAYDQIFGRILKDCMRVQDRRVIANAVDVLCSIRPDDPHMMLREFVNHQDNRIRANALVFEGVRNLQKQDLQILRGMIVSREVNYIASGLYALGEIAGHYKNTDPVFYNTHSNLQKLVDKIQDFFSHENEMVRRQAYFAARKLKDKRLEKAIHNLFRQTKSEEIRSDIRTYYKDGKAA